MEGKSHIKLADSDIYDEVHEKKDHKRSDLILETNSTHANLPAVKNLELKNKMLLVELPTEKTNNTEVFATDLINTNLKTPVREFFVSMIIY